MRWVDRVCDGAFVVLLIAAVGALFWTACQVSEAGAPSSALCDRLEQAEKDRDRYRADLERTQNILKSVVLGLGESGEAPVVKAVSVPVVLANDTALLGLSTSVWPGAKTLTVRVTK